LPGHLLHKPGFAYGRQFYIWTAKLQDSNEGLPNFCLILTALKIKNITMKWSSTLWTCLFVLFTMPFATAQLNCEYTLLMADDFGDSWNGASVTITVDGNATVYTLDFSNSDGSFATATFPVEDGAEITVEFAGGFFDYEIYYAILDSDGALVFEDGTEGAFEFPMIGLVFEGIASCPPCPAPPSTSVSIENIRAFNVDVSWVPSDPLGDYLLEYDTLGFMPGEGNTKIVAGGNTTLFNLEENTAYEVYITAFCANGDTSITVGPYPFQTLWANDVGVSEVLTPQTGCGLGIETIELFISNYGGLPQSLIPFDYSVNGNPSSVSMPQDGFFTGVVGTDSMSLTEFDAVYDFSIPGAYEIQVWTALEADSVITNDTLTLNIVNIPEVQEYPYFDDFEPWSGGWTVESAGFAAPSWEYGTPDGTIINAAASGQNAWVTNLTGPYNNSELSYLVSPCLDFSSLSSDPRLAFSMNFDSESCCDEGWVDISYDDGETWTKVEEVMGSSINWYNDTGFNWWDGTAGFDGWSYVQNRLEGSAGEPEVRIRFVFSTDGSVTREGMALDNIFIGEVAEIDFAATGLSNTSTEPCGSVEDGVALTITNVGTTPQGGYEISYSINGGPAVTETGPQGILPGTSFSYTFNQGFDSSTPGVYEIRAWTDLPGDALQLNDTITFIYRTAIEAPFVEDFEGGSIPPGWVTDFSVGVSNGHNNTSQVIHANVYEFIPSTFFASPVIGPIGSEDTLTFDYRFVDFFEGTTPTDLIEGDSLVVEISTDCGLTYSPVFAITEENHVPAVAMTMVEVPLADFEGQPVSVQFRGVWGFGSGNYWLDVDNVNIKRCPDSLGLSAEIIGTTTQNSNDGEVTVSVSEGVAPYTYAWSNGQNGKTLTGLEAGDYKVTVTDAFGCTDVLDVTISVISNVEELTEQIQYINLAPNPTSGLSTLNVGFAKPVDANIQVLNSVGQLIFETRSNNIREGSYELDLSLQNSGLYLVRIIAEGEIQTAKLIKIR
jgi:hypothetical protein